jgi:hypothetical protein
MNYIRALYRGRDISWTQASYLYPSFMIFLIATALAGAGVLVTRLARVTSRARISSPVRQTARLEPGSSTAET